LSRGESWFRVVVREKER